MKIFISWSGPESHEMALLLRKWIVRVLQYADPFVSSKDIAKGAQWLVEISDQLKDTSEGIVCVTPKNVEAPWLNYEAGALAKTTGQTRVRTVLLGLTPRDLPAGAPLSNFQHTAATDSDDMWSLIESIHGRNGTVDAQGDRVRWAFEQAWPELMEGLKAIDLDNPTGTRSQESDEKSLIKDVLEEVKGLSISLAALGESLHNSNSLSSSQLVGAVDGADVFDLHPGSKVEHTMFGEGVLVHTFLSDAGKVATVQFRDKQRRLLLKYAGLKVIE